MMTDNQRRIAQQDELIHRLAWNHDFGCYSRNGFEYMKWPEIATQARWILYFDIDNMHGLNEAHGGYEPVDAMIRQVLTTLRCTDYVAAQWKSGDEFLICITENPERRAVDPQGLVDRLTEALKQHGITATFAIVPVKSTDLAENVQPAVDQVYAAKKARGVMR